MGLIKSMARKAAFAAVVMVGKRLATGLARRAKAQLAARQPPKQL